jgi:NifB/MoaA-like Fe-S oxidoreductase
MLLDGAERMRVSRGIKGRKIALVTGVLAAPHIEKIAATLSRRGLKADVIQVGNRLFGPEVTVSGLLSGEDIVNAVGDGRLYDAVVLPPNVLNADGMTLDGKCLSDLRDGVGTPVVVGDYDFKETLKRLEHEFTG